MTILHEHSHVGTEGVEPGPPTVALVLGSGGARGYAHIGVVQVMVELGYEVVVVSGSSMGAVVGGMLATGKLEEFTDWAVGLGQFEVLRLMDVSLSAKGAIRGERIFKVVGDMVGDVCIEDLPIEYTAVAVDLLTHREVWFQRGPLEFAIRASTAIPSFVQPVFHNGRVRRRRRTARPGAGRPGHRSTGGSGRCGQPQRTRTHYEPPPVDLNGRVGRG